MKERILKNSSESPLVSIVVITYNSSKYVLETLESAKAQSYNNIELIISDDCSKDDTIDICQNWIKDNDIYFIKTKLIRSSKNTGIPSNANRGVNAAKGEWIKLIAGDDILLDNCININVQFIMNNLNCNFLFSKPIFFGENFSDNDKRNFINTTNDNFYSLTAQNQFLHLLIRNYPMNPPTLFFNRNVLRQLGGFDERFPNEDFPLYLKVTKAGHKLYFISRNTVKYRFHNQSISFRKNLEAVNFWKRLKFKKTIREHITFPLFKKHPLIVIDFYNQLIINILIINFGNTYNIRNILKPLRLLSPLYFKEKLMSKG